MEWRRFAGLSPPVFIPDFCWRKRKQNSGLVGRCQNEQKTVDGRSITNRKRHMLQQQRLYKVQISRAFRAFWWSVGGLVRRRAANFELYMNVKQLVLWSEF